jgi:hypothetical protein
VIAAPDPWLAHQRTLAREIAAVLDEATVAILTLTSSPAALSRVADEERTNRSAYDAAPTVWPTDRLAWCLGCGARFWAVARGGRRCYCSRRCCAADYWRNNAAYRERRHAARRALDNDPAYRQRRNAARRAKYRDDPAFRARERARGRANDKARRARRRAEVA